MYTSQKEDEWGLVSVKATVLDKTQSMQEYISKMAVEDELLRKSMKQQQTQEENQAKEVPCKTRVCTESIINR